MSVQPTPVATAEPVQAVEPREEPQGVAAVIPDRHPPAPPAPPAQPARVVVQVPEPATEAAPEPETLNLRPSVQEPAIAGGGVVPQKTESAIPAWAAAGVATLAATLALVGGVQLIRKRGVWIPRKLRKLRGSTGRRPGKLRVS